MAAAELVGACKSVLAANDLGDWTRPAEGVYPCQWLWDSCVIALGYSTFDWVRAAAEVESLFRGQWVNGFIPHIRFEGASGFYPGCGWWDTGELSGAGVASTGITQPPLIADTVWRLFERRPDEETGIAFLERVYLKLRAYHSWLRTYRDAGSLGYRVFDGLALIFHFDESGMDDLPAWDVIRDRHLTYVSDEAASMAQVKMRTEPVELGAQRPNEDFFAVNYEYAIRLKRAGYMPAPGELDDIPFQVADALFNSVWARSNQSLAGIADVLGKKEDSRMYRGWARKTQQAMDEHMWDDGARMYFDFDLLGGEKVTVKTASSFTPLFTGACSKSRARDLADALFDEENGFITEHMIPSTSTLEQSFDPFMFWRGPVWPFTNWILIQGLLDCGFDEAGVVREHTLALAESGVREYYNPESGAGLGAENFSPMAAVALDLLATC